MASGRNIVVVAASAGGLQPLRTMLNKLPADLPAAVLVVLHVPATSGSSLPRILDRAGPLSASRAIDGEQIRPGHVYVAPPDWHLLLARSTVRLSHGPRQNGLRPAADPLFRSAALDAGPRTTAVVLSGTLDDAALGGATVERRGGRVIVQDPAEADYDSMPRSVLATTEHAIVASAGTLAEEVTRLATEEVSMRLPDVPGPDEELTAEIAGLLAGGPETNTQTRDYSGLSCPDCGGPLFTTHEVGAETYDCLVGHRWSPQSLFEGHSSAVERGLWLAIRALEERGRLAARLAEGARQRGHQLSTDQLATAAKEAQLSADAIRAVVQGMITEVAAERDEA